jgi:dihydrofolate reductase
MKDRPLANAGDRRADRLPPTRYSAADSTDNHRRRHYGRLNAFNRGADKSEVRLMGTVAVHEFMTLDGVIDAPTWTFDYPLDPKMGEAIAALMGACNAILLGRTTYEMFEPAWSARTAEDDPGAPFMNGTPKYVVSSTLTHAEWNNSTVLGPYSAQTIRDLKDRVDGGMYVSGSGTLVRALLADRLVDELHLFVFPLALGSGQRLFPDGAGPTKLALAGCEAYTSGALHLTYTPATTS